MRGVRPVLKVLALAALCFWGLVFVYLGHAAGAAEPVAFSPCGQTLHLYGTPSPCSFHYSRNGALVWIAGHWYPVGSTAANAAAVRAGINPLAMYQL